MLPKVGEPRSAIDRVAAASVSPGPVEVALLDLDGIIVAVNEAWEAFCTDNGGDPLSVGVGSSYLDACAADRHDPTSLVVAKGIRTALRGDLPAPMKVELSCHSPEMARWYDMLISSRLHSDGSCIGATVTLSLAHAVLSTEVGEGPGARSDRSDNGFARAMAPVESVTIDDHGVIVAVSRPVDDADGSRPDPLVGTPVDHLLPRQQARERPASRRPEAQREGTGSDAAVDGPRTMFLSEPTSRHRRPDGSRPGGDGGMAIDDLDQVIRLLSACALEIAGTLDNGLPGETAAVLRHAVAELDMAATMVRMTVFRHLRDRADPD